MRSSGFLIIVLALIVLGLTAIDTFSKEYWGAKPSLAGIENGCFIWVVPAPRQKQVVVTVCEDGTVKKSTRWKVRKL